MEIFSSAEILLPDVKDLSAWAVIACDQFTSDADYWKETERLTGDAPSALHLILPEIFLETPDMKKRIEKIHACMEEYLKNHVFRSYPDTMIYTERIQSDQVLRTGVIGKIDLEAYDYHEGSVSPIRATEATVLDRIPPRMQIREHACLELPHIMILIDDPGDTVIGGCMEQKTEMEQLYDTDLMQGGGHVTGWRMNQAQQAAFQARLQKLFSETGDLKIAMGDGNHSLATAKACYEALKKAHPEQDFSNHPARYALAELVNLHSPALQFEAIHRVVTQTDTADLWKEISDTLALSEIPAEQSLIAVRNQQKKKYYIHQTFSSLAVGSLQTALDKYLKNHPGKMDYIHGAENAEHLANQPDGIAFLLPDMNKKELFPAVSQSGALPRKTFSLGHARDKRYYIEARKIR